VGPKWRGGDLTALSALLTGAGPAFGFCEPPGALDLGALMFRTLRCALRYNLNQPRIRYAHDQ
jgi:hypothetical protein